MNGGGFGIRESTADDGIDKAWFVRAEDPGDTDDGMEWRSSKHLEVSFQFGRSIVTERPGHILFGVRPIQSSVKNLVRADVDKTGAARCAEARKPTRSLGIDFGGHLRIAFAGIHIGGCRTIHNDITSTEFLSGKSRLSLYRIGEINLRTGQGEELDIGKRRPLSRQRGSETPIGTKYQDFHIHRLNAGGWRLKQNPNPIDDN